MYIDQSTLRRSLSQLYGTAGHLLKIWLVLKHMGLRSGGDGIHVDTSNSTDSLKALFDCGADDNRFYVPFAHTSRYLTMKHDASRSIVQTTVQRWATSGSVVTCDPTEYLDITNDTGSKLTVKPTRAYPLGLGIDESGFVLEDSQRVSLPLIAFAIWYGNVRYRPAGAMMPKTPRRSSARDFSRVFARVSSNSSGNGRAIGTSEARARVRTALFRRTSWAS